MFKKLLKISILTFFIFSAMGRLSFIVTADSSYKGIDSAQSESPHKFMYTNYIIVDANTAEIDLRKILDKAVKEFGDEIKNYKQPTKQSVIYAYLSEQAYRDSKGSWVGMAFWILGKGNAEININKDKLESARQEQIEQAPKEEPYAGVYGPDGNYRTIAILPLEKQVHDALKREFDLNPEPTWDKFTSNDAWVDACDAVDARCINKVAKDFNLSENTVKDIWSKVTEFKH